MTGMYPLKFKPILKTVVWGGDKIASFKHLQTDRDHIGESWEISAIPGQESVVAEGSWAGRSIGELTRMYKGLLVGRHVYAESGDLFPLLAKFIDAESNLSIQVHPNDSLAYVRHGGARGKTEMWYVICAEPGARLVSGITKSFTPQEYEDMVAEGRITEVIASHEVAPGDVFFLPPGRIHAIGGGCFVAEIQQTSDITYRIYDYNRPGLDGKPRELHTELAKDAIDYTVYPDYRTDYEPRENEPVELISCPCFTTEVWDIEKPVRRNLSRLDSFLILMCVGGEGILEDSEPRFQYGEDGQVLCDDAGKPLTGPTRGHRITVRQGETVLIPASSKGIRLIPAEGSGLQLLTSYIR